MNRFFSTRLPARPILRPRAAVQPGILHRTARRHRRTTRRRMTRTRRSRRARSRRSNRRNKLLSVHFVKKKKIQIRVFEWSVVNPLSCLLSYVFCFFNNRTRTCVNKNVKLQIFLFNTNVALNLKSIDRLVIMLTK